jgi:Phosphotransferase enzyme family
VRLPSAAGSSPFAGEVCDDHSMSDHLWSLLARVGIDPAGWQTGELPHNKWLTPGIWQLSRGDERIIVKWLSADRPAGLTPYERHWTARSDEQTRWNYWAREALAYRDGIAELFDASVMATATCVGVDITEEDAVLALAFVDGVPGDMWSIDQYAVAGYALGRSQGMIAVHGTLPSTPWLSQGFLREYTSEKSVNYELLDDDAAWDQPLVRECFPSELRAAVALLHRHAARLHDVMEALPRTLCHLDFWTKNLITGADGRVVMLDWAFVGDGAIGEDIGNLIPDAAFDHFIPSAQLSALDDAVFGAYVRGLRNAGWDGDERLVQLAVWASAVKYDWLTALMLERASAARQMKYGGTDEVDPVFLYRERGEALLFNAQRAAAALALADELGY